MKDNDLIPLTEEDKIMGITEPKRKTELMKNAFTGYKYLLNGVDVVAGEIIGNILPTSLKSEIMHGAIEVQYKGMTIKRIEEEKQEEVVEVKKPVKKPVAKKTKKG